MRSVTTNIIGANFLKEYAHSLVLLLKISDLLAVLVAALAAYHLQHTTLRLSIDYKIMTILGLLLSFMFFKASHLYRPWRGLTLTEELLLILRVWTAMLIVLFVIIGIVLPEMAFNKLEWIILWGLMGCIFSATSRLVLRSGLGWLRARGWNQRRVLIVGLSEMAITTVRQINKSPWTGLQAIGYVDDRAQPRIENPTYLARLGTVNELAEIVEREEIDQVWLGYPFRGEQRAKQALHVLRYSPINIRFLIDIYAFNRLNQSLSSVAGIPVLDILVSPLDGLNRYLKELEDRVLSLIILISISPLLATIAIGIKLSSPGPIFYKQERVGWNNRNFMILKFRSMPVDVEEKTGPIWSKPREKRATQFGAFLRRTSLDELPQLFNVLKGDMSLVGPRPERPVFVEEFKDQVPYYMKKHMVKAGITGWAQVNGWRGSTDLKKRIEYDLYYIQNWSIWFDLRIVLQTLLTGFINKNAY